MGRQVENSGRWEAVAPRMEARGLEGGVLLSVGIPELGARAPSGHGLGGRDAGRRRGISKIGPRDPHWGSGTKGSGGRARAADAEERLRAGAEAEPGGHLQ